MRVRQNSISVGPFEDFGGSLECRYKSASFMLSGSRQSDPDEERAVMAEPVISAIRLSSAASCHQSLRRCSVSKGERPN